MSPTANNMGMHGGYRGGRLTCECHRADAELLQLRELREVPAPNDNDTT
jgi:hypothetical protein